MWLKKATVWLLNRATAKHSNPEDVTAMHAREPKEQNWLCCVGGRNSVTLSLSPAHSLSLFLFPVDKKVVANHRFLRVPVCDRGHIALFLCPVMHNAVTNNP